MEILKLQLKADVFKEKMKKWLNVHTWDLEVPILISFPTTVPFQIAPSQQNIYFIY